MSVSQPVLAVTVFGRDYQFKVPQGQQTQLQQLADSLNEKLSVLHSQSPLSSRDQLLVLTTLNTLLELSQLQQQSAQAQRSISNLLQQISGQLKPA
ncbi:cell division protein ZapA [Rheinheimera muenzenbergensis]|uniref:Cell division protein ZapA n=1 Tax=Rheinheimera muenzenbergensis TaxID=1193628 RepID=A0ABU8C776_9GAMM